MCIRDRSYTNFSVFNFKIPIFVPNVPTDLLHPRNSWGDKEEYNNKRIELAEMFAKNFTPYEKFVSEDIIKASPKQLLETSL